MIDYEMLCQTIEDWRAGRRPSIDLSATPAGAAEEYADPGYADPYAEAQPGYEDYPAADEHYAAEPEPEPEPDYQEDDGEYVAAAEPAYEAEPGYEEVPEAGYEEEEEDADYEYDGAPAPIAAGGTAPVVVDEDFDEELDEQP